MDLKVSTLDLGKNEESIEARIDHLIVAVKTLNPAILTLQNVPAPGLERLNEFLGDLYVIWQGWYSPTNMEKRDRSGIVLLVSKRMPPNHVTFTELPYNESRCQIIMCRVEIGDRTLCVLGCQLEEGKHNDHFRVTQFRTLLSKLVEGMDTIIMGNFNIVRDDEHRIQEGLEKLLAENQMFNDVWRSQGFSSSVKYTVDVGRNVLAKKLFSRSSRPDRVLFHSAGKPIRIDSSRLWARDNCLETGVPISAHYGLEVKFRI